MGIVSFLTVRIVEIIVVILLIVFMPNVPPKANFSYFKVTPAPALEGKIALNTKLNGAQRIYENELKGAEAFAEYNGELYTSLHTGEIAKLSKGHIVPIVKFGKPCAGFIEESICGRPLGLRFDKHGILYVADAYMGIWKVDVKTGQKIQLVSMEDEIEGKKPVIPNSVAISETGDFYWTDSSTEFKLEDGVYTLLADGSGRLLHYNAKTKTNKVLIDSLHFPNGVILSPGEDFLIVAETGSSRLHRYYLTGPKEGTHDIFLDGLPGLPDNLNSDGHDAFFVPLVFARDADHPTVPQIFGPFPLVRKLFSRIIALTELGFMTLHRIYPTVYSQTAIHWIGHFESVSIFMIPRATVLRVSYTGEVLDCMHGTDESVSGISEAIVFGDHLYLGSPFNPYIGKIPLSKVGLDQLARNKRNAPVKQAPPPTAAPVKRAPPPTPAPIKQTPPPTKAPTTTPPPTKAPITTPPPTKAPTTTPPPTKAPTTTPPPTKAPTTTPPPTKAPTTKTPAKKTPQPTQAPVKQTTTPPPKKQTPPPAPVREPTPIRESSPPLAAKQTPPPAKAPVKQATPPTAAPVKQAPSTKQTPTPAPAPTKQTPHPTRAPITQTSPPAQPKTKSEKDTPQVVPVKENAVPKSESIKPRK